jgi:hypothetical protein
VSPTAPKATTTKEKKLFLFFFSGIFETREPRMFSSQNCPSKYYKEWHPDYIASYNSLNDRHLQVPTFKTFFLCI